MTLRIGTYNIKVGVDSSPATLAATLCRLNMDIIALQEVGSGWQMGVPIDQSAYLAAAAGLGYVHFAGALTDTLGGQFGISLLSRWPIQSSRCTQLPREADEQRVLLEVKVEAPTPFTLLTPHLSIADGERAAQLKLIRDRAAACPGPLILLGDLNARPESPPLQALCSAELQDAFSVAGEGPGESFSVVDPHRRIDYIFTRVFQTRRCWLARDERGSDHFPLLAELSLPSEPHLRSDEVTPAVASHAEGEEKE